MSFGKCTGGRYLETEGCQHWKNQSSGRKGGKREGRSEGGREKGEGKESRTYGPGRCERPQRGEARNTACWRLARGGLCSCVTHHTYMPSVTGEYPGIIPASRAQWGPSATTLPPYMFRKLKDMQATVFNPFLFLSLFTQNILIYLIDVASKLTYLSSL